MAKKALVIVIAAALIAAFVVSLAFAQSIPPSL
jgi:hypothetical protein